jgi:hypothetical protein
VKPLTIAITALAFLGLTGCGVSINTGGSSGPSEKDVANLVEHHNISNAECVKSTNGSDRDFTCTGHAGGRFAKMTVEVTVSESGKTVVITHCESHQPEGQYGGTPPGRREPCGEVR